MPKYIPKRLPGGVASVEGLSRPLQKPRLMAPAGDWECVRAAVENGADAVYFGLDRFNARMRAHNFTRSDLPELMAFLHHRGVAGYLTFNTLVFTEELEDAKEFLSDVIRAGVDAAIVQDVGVCRLIRELSPDFPIHASTQMSITSEAGVQFAHELGASVTVLARECSIEEIGSIRQKNLDAGLDMPLEIFVHGALCVAYSGQCLTSEALGGRSANRGECAQACRLPFELVADGILVPLGDRRYLLSPQDLSGVNLLPEIIRAGVTTLKIEGRLKTPEYVSAVTQVYRRALDRAWDELCKKQAAQPISKEDQYTLEMSFSRGLDSGWLEGINNQRLVHARFGKKRGVRVGIVDQVTHEGVWITPESELKAGDGVVFDAGHPDQPEQGGRVRKLQNHRGSYFIDFMPDAVDFRRIERGQIVWKTSDPRLERELKKSFEVEQPAVHRPVSMIVEGELGKALVLQVFDEQERTVTISSDQTLIPAENRPIDKDLLIKQLGRLGNTAYRLETLENRIKGACMIPMSVLNQMRREAVELLDAERRRTQQWILNSRPEEVLSLPPTGKRETGIQFIPYVRDWEQFRAVLSLPCEEIYLELENPRDYREAVQLFREQSPGKERSLWVAPPRIFKTGEQWIIEKLLACGADGFLVRNHEHLWALQGHRLRGDFSLNIANPLAAEWFIQRWGLERLTASYDLNHDQLLSLLKHSPENRFEITLHQHMPMFHMEHCVFCAFLTSGKDFRDCGRPCDTRKLALRDRVEMLHPVKADAGCRNTVFNAKAQTGAEYLQSFAAQGVLAFRIEFLQESPEEVIRTLHHYEQLRAGSISADQLWKELKLINQLGVTRGTLR
jgi:U32 family peptidase